MWTLDKNGNEVWKQPRRKQGICYECDTQGNINPIYASHSADVQFWLCDACKDKRIDDLNRFYAGE